MLRAACVLSPARSSRVSTPPRNRRTTNFTAVSRSRFGDVTENSGLANVELHGGRRKERLRAKAASARSGALEIHKL
jgi:hypothetical protein